MALATGFSLRLPAEPASTDVPTEVARPVKTTLNASVLDGEKAGSEANQSVVMSLGGRRLMLNAPQGFRANTTNPNKVTFANQDFSCVLSFRVVSPGSAAASALNPDLCRCWLATWLVDLRIQEEFSLTVPGGSGPAFDLKCKVDGVVRASRVAFIASPIGVLEFNSLSSPKNLKQSSGTSVFYRVASESVRPTAGLKFSPPSPSPKCGVCSHPGPGGMESANLSSDARSFFRSRPR